MTDTRRRVKLYELNAERQWDDKGTGGIWLLIDLDLIFNLISGHVSSTYVERLKGISLVVRSEVVTNPPPPQTATQPSQTNLTSPQTHLQNRLLVTRVFIFIGCLGHNCRDEKQFWTSGWMDSGFLSSWAAFTNHSQADASLLLESKIQSDTAYQVFTDTTYRVFF